ncbi:cytochrome c3 family protein [Geomonas subterranea]|uniref:cytochrome c3 family protein n=1 Tax=Geomonas subterranea TaxID=2847989 RepID=UPI001C45EB5F|nr:MULTISPECIES: cytochrome c3 family protein [Geomonas]QXM10945.1 NapC/NirT family cytochrome c [Geomonas subterranea]
MGFHKTTLSAILLTFVAVSAMPAAAATGEGILTTRHNLSKSGPGPIKTESETQVCIFCHTPHHASSVTPLWSRPMATTVYSTYSSTTRFAQPGQPTGSSRLCLSCHDGTIAVGALINDVSIPMAGGFTTIPIESPSNIGGKTGADLTNDHPISFKYGADLVTKNKQLRLPSEIDRKLKLDAGENMQCTTCHNPHTDPYGKFLVMSNANSALCVSCHNVTGWQGSVHKSDPLGAVKGCQNCHVPHNAKMPQRLMKGYPEEMNCLPCHSPSGGARDIQSLLALPSRHDVRDTTGVHDTAESVLGMQKHVECEDCHNPHAVQSLGAVAPAVNGALDKVRGVALGGEVKETALYEYEVCFKCHGDKNFSSTPIVRQLPSLNLRLKFALENPSYHPVEGPGKVSPVQSLRNDLGYTSSSVIYCTACHGSDQSVKAGGTGPNGPHGSNYPYLLLARYDTETYPRSYSDSSYALCFRCHAQERLFAATSPFSVPATGLPLHDLHVVQQGVPCFICHDPHGTSRAGGATDQKNSHLINFATNFQVVASYDGTSYPRSCTSSCHSDNPRTYGPAAAPAGRLVPRIKRPALRPF